MSTNIKNTIADIFWKLTNTKHIDKITVKDVVEECGVSRQTFYYHFQDILEVVEWTADREIQTMVVQSLKAKTLEEGIQQTVHFFFSHKKIWNRLLTSKSREHFEKMVTGAIHRYMMSIIKLRTPEVLDNYADVEMMVHFLTYGVGGLFLEYANRSDVTEEQFTKQLYRLLSGQMKNPS